MLLLCSGVVPSAHGASLERGIAIIDPLALKELDLREHRTDGGADPHASLGFGLNRMLDPAASDNAPMTNDRLFALPSMAPIRKALDAEFERYISERKAESPRETVGVGPSFDFQLFDRALLYSGETRFVLAGIVNRMDRAYVAPENCGEIRLIYRLTRLDQGPVGETASPPLGPMTLNVVLRAKREELLGPGGIAITCKNLAQRWLAIA